MKPSRDQRRRWTAEPGSELARLRQECHRAYDVLWEFGILSRSEVYRRLALALKIHQSDCHFGMFDEKLCRKALALRSSPIFMGPGLDGNWPETGQ